MKRILIFSLAYYPNYVSGAEVAIKEITDRTPEDEIEFHLITHLFDRGATREEKIGKVRVYRVGFGGAYLSKILFVPLAALRARALHRKVSFTGMWAMMTYMLLPLTLARWLGVTVPYLLTLQDGDPYDTVFGRWFIKPALPILDSGFKNARFIQVISEYLGTWPKMRGYTGEVVLVRNGANPESITPTFNPSEVEDLKQKLGKREGDVYLVNTARLVYQKGFDTTVRALPLLPPHVKLLVVGGGPEDENLKSLVEELGLGSRVIFTGHVERSEVTKYRMASDIFVGPSRSEGLGNAFLSAMACRLPVIATQEGGIADFLFDAKRNPSKEATGWAVDKENSEQIARVVQDILAHPEKVREVTERARKMVEEEYDWDTVAQKMKKEIFDRLV